MAVFDATFLVLLLDPDANPPIDPATGFPVTHGKERIEYLVQQLEQTAEKVIVPTPALAEFLVKADAAAPEYLRTMERSAALRIAPFDTRSAVELAALTAEALRRGDKFDGSTEPWQKVKFDRQIVAIAKVEGQKKIYSDDPGLSRFAKLAGIEVVSVSDLELPPEAKQPELQFSDRERT